MPMRARLRERRFRDLTAVNAAAPRRAPNGAVPRGTPREDTGMATVVDPQAAPPPPRIVDFARFDAPGATCRREPVAFLVATGVLPPAAQAALYRDFPRYEEAGFFDHEPARCGPGINALVEEIRSRAFADRIGDKLGIRDLGSKPMLVHLSFLQNRRHGTIHTDSRATLATVLFYFSADWPHGSNGCLRFLRGDDDIGATIAPEVKPLYGTLVAFRRSSRSYHGYLPFEGERPVIKAAWLTSEAELARKTRRSHSTHFVKRVLGPLDRWFDARRDASKAHRN